MNPNAAAWLAAISLFVAGDLLTTQIGLQLGAVEANPYQTHASAAAILTAKAAVIGLAGAYYRRAEVYANLIPLSLAAVGGVVVAWNLSVIASLA